MAVQRLTLSNIVFQIRLALGESDEDFSQISDANLYVLINAYGNQIPNRLGSVARNQGLSVQDGALYPDWLKSSGSLTTSSGSSSVTFPSDYIRYLYFFDETNSKRLYSTDEAGTFQVQRLKVQKPGPPRAIEILGVNSSSLWTGTLYPPTETGITPNISLVYWRLPAQMPGSSPSAEYPDAPANFHSLWVYGTLLELLRPDDPAYSRYQEKEQAMLEELLVSAKVN